MRTACIINGSNGHAFGSKQQASLERALGGAPLTFHRTDYPGHATQIARSQAEHNAQAVIVVGGDGTINEVINGLCGSKVKLGIIPAGTANDLARHLHIPHNIEKACDVIAAGNAQSIDLISVNGWRYATVGGIGLGCDTVKQMELLRATLRSTVAWRLLQHRLYLLSLLFVYRRTVKHPFPVTIATSGHSFSTQAVSVIVANQPTVGRLFSVAPDASDCDGRANIFLIESARGHRSIARAVASTLIPAWRHTQAIHRFSAADATVVLSSPASFFGDGELREPASCFLIEVLPGALTVFAPHKETTR